MTGPLSELERSLRNGPPDESGYRPRLLNVRPGDVDDAPTRIMSHQRVVGGTSVRRAAPTPVWQYLAAVLVVAVSFAALGMIRTRLEPGVDGPASPSLGTGSPNSSQQASAGSSTPSILVPPLTQTFTSQRNGFSVDHPADWTVTRATASWPANAFLVYGHSALDTLARSGVARLMIASQALSNGQTEEEWLGAFFHPYAGGTPCGGNRTTWPRLEIDGVLGYLDLADCPVPADARISDRDVGFDALVFAGGRVYEIGLDGDVDLAYFKALLATVRLDPSKAID